MEGSVLSHNFNVADPFDLCEDGYEKLTLASLPTITQKDPIEQLLEGRSINAWTASFVPYLVIWETELIKLLHWINPSFQLKAEFSPTWRSDAYVMNLAVMYLNQYVITWPKEQKGSTFSLSVSQFYKATTNWAIILVIFSQSSDVKMSCRSYTINWHQLELYILSKDIVGNTLIIFLFARNEYGHICEKVQWVPQL